MSWLKRLFGSGGEDVKSVPSAPPPQVTTSKSDSQTSSSAARRSAPPSNNWGAPIGAGRGFLSVLIKGVVYNASTQHQLGAAMPTVVKNAETKAGQAADKQFLSEIGAALGIETAHNFAINLGREFDALQDEAFGFAQSATRQIGEASGMGLIPFLAMTTSEEFEFTPGELNSAVFDLWKSVRETVSRRSPGDDRSWRAAEQAISAAVMEARRTAKNVLEAST